MARNRWEIKRVISSKYWVLKFEKLMHNYKELKVWQKAVQLSTAVYSLCSELPAEEKYGLKSQMQRCSVSIASNIAEGAGRNSNKEFKYFLSIANGSCYELETQ